MPCPETPTRHRSAPVVAMLVLAALPYATAPASASVVTAVSPGDSGAVTPAAGPCPTFSWTFDPAAEGYDLVAYRLRSSGGADPVQDEPPVLRQSLPAGAVSWTPPADRCLLAGEEYVWFVRAETAGASSAWSEGNLFRVVDALEVAGPAAAGQPNGGEDHAPAPAARHTPTPRSVGLAAPAAAAPLSDPRPASAIAPKAAGALFSVNGGIKAAGNYAFASPQTVHRAFPPTAFVVANSQEDDQWFIDPSGSGTIRGGVAGLDVRLALALDDLPIGATVKTLACRFRDAEEGEDMSGNFTLARRFVTSGNDETMAQISFATSGSSSSPGLAITHSISHPVVEKFYHYWILGGLTVEGPFFTLEFLGCELEYDVDRLDTR